MFINNIKNLIKGFIVEENLAKRNVSFISYIRVYATIVAIFNHVVINCINDFPGFPIPMHKVVLFNHYVTYILLMMTGYTYMKMKSHITIKMSFFMMAKYYVAMMLFAIPFSFMEILYRARYVFNIEMIKVAIIEAFKGHTWDHLWYIYMLLAIYLILPLLSRIYKNENKLLLPYFTIIMFVCCFFNVEIRILNTFYMLNWLPFNNILFAVSFGALVYNYKIFPKINGVGMFILTFIYGGIWFKFHLNNYYITVIILSALIFLTFERLFIWKNKFINYLSKYTFLIYILHVLFLHVVTKIFKISPFAMGGYIGMIICTLILYVITMLFSMIIMKIPYIKDLYN